MLIPYHHIISFAFVRHFLTFSADNVPLFAVNMFINMFSQQV